MFAEEENCESIIVTGDINFEHTCWKTLSSQNEYEIQILEKLSHQFPGSPKSENTKPARCVTNQ